MHIDVATYRKYWADVYSGEITPIYKRDNWTGREVHNFILGQQCVGSDKISPENQKMLDEANKKVSDLTGLFDIEGTYTNEQILDLLSKQGEHGDNVSCFFYDFARDEKEFGAMAYNAEIDTVVHIGRSPEEIMAEQENT